jgi:hypothetical protein
MFPAVVVVKMPVGISVTCPPVVAIPVGAVIVSIAVVPETNTICVVGAMVAALATVGATCPVAVTPNNLVTRVAVVPITVVFVPNPVVDFPITIELESPAASELLLSPIKMLLDPVVIVPPAPDPIPTQDAPVVNAPSAFAPHAAFKVPLLQASID